MAFPICLWFLPWQVIPQLYGILMELAVGHGATREQEIQRYAVQDPGGKGLEMANWGASAKPQAWGRARRRCCLHAAAHVGGTAIRVVCTASRLELPQA